MNVYKKDLKRIGYQAGESDGNLAIVCHCKTAGVEGILLREILKLFGNKIIAEGDNVWIDNEETEHVDWEYLTDMKWGHYKKL